MPRNTPENRKSKARRRKDAKDSAAEDDAARRSLCSALRFWEICSSRQCRRARACAGDAGACFTRCWPQVPEVGKVMVRAIIKAGAARLPPHEIVAEVSRELQRWREMEAKLAELYSPPETAARESAPPEPVLPSQETARTARPTGPRLRAL